MSAGEPPAAAMGLVILLAVLGLFTAMSLFARNYVKVPPSMAAVVYGRTRVSLDASGRRGAAGYRIVTGGGFLRIPVLEQVTYLPLHVLSIAVSAGSVSARADVKLGGDGDALRTAAEHFLGLDVEQIRGVIGRVIEGHLPAARPAAAAAEDLRRLGVRLVALTIER